MNNEEYKEAQLKFAQHFVEYLTANPDMKISQAIVELSVLLRQQAYPVHGKRFSVRLKNNKRAKAKRPHKPYKARRPKEIMLDERVKEMKRLKLEENWTLEEIGIQYNISRERVRQLLAKHGIKYEEATSAFMLAQRAKKEAAQSEKLAKRALRLSDQNRRTEESFEIASKMLAEGKTWAEIKPKITVAPAILLRDYPQLRQHRPRSRIGQNEKEWINRYTVVKKVLKGGGSWNAAARAIKVSPTALYYLRSRFPDLETYYKRT